MVSDYYELLEVSRGASEDEIRTAFREKVKEYHPDVSDDPQAARKFRMVHDAREVLTDPTERRRYDRLGHESYYGGSGDDSDDAADRSDASDRSRSARSSRTSAATDHTRAAGSRSERRSTRTTETDADSGRRSATDAEAGTATGTGTDAGATTETDAGSKSANAGSTPGATTAGQWQHAPGGVGRSGSGSVGTSGGRTTGGRTTGANRWRGTSTGTAYPERPFADPVSNLVARAWGIRLGILAGVVGVLLFATWFFQRIAEYGAVPDAPARIAASVVGAARFDPVGLGVLAALTIAVFLGYAIAVYGAIPARQNDAVVPKDRSIALSLSIAAGGIVLGATGYRLGGDPAAFAGATAVPFAVSALVCLALFVRIVGVDTAGVLALPTATIVTAFVARPSALAIPADALSGSAMGPSLAFAVGIVVLWSIGVGLVRGTAQVSLLAWNLRYRGEYRIQPAVWDVLLALPVLVLAWLYVGGHAVVPFSDRAIAFAEPLGLLVADGHVTRATFWIVVVVTPVLVGTLLYARRGIETLLTALRERLE